MTPLLLKTLALPKQEVEISSGDRRPHSQDPHGSFFVPKEAWETDEKKSAQEYFLDEYRRTKKEKDPAEFISEFKSLVRVMNTYIYKIQDPVFGTQKEYKEKVQETIVLIKKISASVAAEEQKLLAVEKAPKKVRKKSLEHYQEYSKSERHALIEVFQQTRGYIKETKEKMNKIISTTHVHKEKLQSLPKIITFHKENITHLFFENTLLHNVYRSILNKEELQMRILKILPEINIHTLPFAPVPGHTEFFYQKMVAELEQVHGVIKMQLVQIKEEQPENYKHCVAVFLETQLQFETSIANNLRKSTGVPIHDLSHYEEHKSALGPVPVTGKLKKEEQVYTCPVSGIEGTIDSFNIHHKGKRSHLFYSAQENLVGIHKEVHAAIHFITDPLKKLDGEIKVIKTKIALMQQIPPDQRGASFEKELHFLLTELEAKQHKYNKYYVGTLLLTQEQLDARFAKTESDTLRSFYRKHGKKFRSILNNYIQVHLMHCIPATLLRNIRIANTRKEQEFQLRSLTPSKISPSIFVEKSTEIWRISPLPTHP